MEDLIDDILTKKKRYKTQLWIILLHIGIYALLILCAYQQIKIPMSKQIGLGTIASLCAYNINDFSTLLGKDWLNNLCFAFSLIILGTFFYGAFFNHGYPISKANLLDLMMYFGIAYIFFQFRKQYRIARHELSVE